MTPSLLVHGNLMVHLETKILGEQNESTRRIQPRLIYIFSTFDIPDRISSLVRMPFFHLQRPKDREPISWADDDDGFGRWVALGTTGIWALAPRNVPGL